MIKSQQRWMAARRAWENCRAVIRCIIRVETDKYFLFVSNCFAYFLSPAFSLSFFSVFLSSFEFFWGGFFAKLVGTFWKAEYDVTEKLNCKLVFQPGKATYWRKSCITNSDLCPKWSSWRSYRVDELHHLTWCWNSFLGLQFSPLTWKRKSLKLNYQS